jgi:hypothetical protein
MTIFDGSQPANDSKIRDFPSLVRDNFNAIIEGNSTAALTKATLAVQGGDPTLITDKLIVFAKDSNSESALFVKNDADDTLQLTDQEYLGGASQKIKAASIRFGAGTVDNNQNAMVTAWGRIATSGSVSAAYNMTSSKVTNSPSPLDYYYQVTFVTPMANANYAAIVTAESNDVKPETATVYSKTINGFRIQIKDTVEDFKLRACNVIVCGGL